MGIVHVLTNAAMPGLVKIGMTDDDDANARIGQLYNDRSVFVGREKNVFALGNTRSTDDPLRHPSVGPFGFAHRAQLRKHFRRGGLQLLPIRGNRLTRGQDYRLLVQPFSI